MQGGASPPAQLVPITWTLYICSNRTTITLYSKILQTCTHPRDVTHFPSPSWAGDEIPSKTETSQKPLNTEKKITATTFCSTRTEFTHALSWPNHQQQKLQINDEVQYRSKNGMPIDTPSDLQADRFQCCLARIKTCSSFEHSRVAHPSSCIVVHCIPTADQTFSRICVALNSTSLMTH